MNFSYLCLKFYDTEQKASCHVKVIPASLRYIPSVSQSLCPTTGASFLPLLLLP